MSRAEKPKSSFETLVRPSEEAWRGLLSEFNELFSDANVDVVYGMPEALTDALAQTIPGFFTDRELGFERELSAFLRRHYSVGLVHGKLIRSSLFEDRRNVKVSPEDFAALGWEKNGLTCEKANQLSTEIESRAVHFHEQLVAYAGWLVTNSTFLREVALLREREKEFLGVTSDEERMPFIREMYDFCVRWQLARMATWDLPEPQGPNLGGIELPASVRRGAEKVSLEFPLSTRLPARFPIRDLIAEIRNQAAQPRLKEWQEILDRESKSGPGLRQFQTMLHIQFFRNIMLSSRYLSRFDGQVEALDRAFGVFLEVGQDSVKKVRLEIDKRVAR
jgi:hypothetical protein